MSSIPFFNNLVSWLMQVSLVALMGALFPILFRIRHPKTQLAYYHAVLLACVVVPLIEPWQHPFVVANGIATAPAASGIEWMTIIKWVITAGILAKLVWLAAGLRQVRSFRASSSPVFPIPDAIQGARTLTRSDAVFRISRCVSGPATLGHLDPVILLPESFLSMDPDAQLSIACHELIHVKRHDWLVMLAEEIVGAIFWFNPAIWLLLSQTRFSREQLVDFEVVELTAARAPYVQALLSMAVPVKRMKPAPAASFFGEGHLARRVRSLLTERKGSIAQLLVSYASIAGLLVATGWGVILLFPLRSAAQVPGASPRIVEGPRLHEWRKPSSDIHTQTFTIRVPAPNGAVGGAAGIVGGNTADSALQPPPPPPPPPPTSLQSGGPFGFLVARGVRVIGLGEKATPDDIARMQQGLGERTVLQVVQTPDGTVQRITVIGRRISDENANQNNAETHTVPSDVIFGTGGPGPAGPANFTYRIH